MEIHQQELELVAPTEPREVFEYVNGEKSDRPRVDQKGRPLLKYSASISWQGSTHGGVTVLSATAPAEAKFGTVYRVSDATVTILNDRQGWAPRISVLAGEIRQIGAEKAS